MISCYFVKNVEKISVLPEYKNQSFKELDMFFLSGDLRVENEKVVIELLLKWVNELQKSRGECSGLGPSLGWAPPSAALLVDI